MRYISVKALVMVVMARHPLFMSIREELFFVEEARG
jgi:hypothetical protein